MHNSTEIKMLLGIGMLLVNDDDEIHPGAMGLRNAVKQILRGSMWNHRAFSGGFVPPDRPYQDKAR